MLGKLGARVSDSRLYLFLVEAFSLSKINCFKVSFREIGFLEFGSSETGSEYL